MTADLTPSEREADRNAAEARAGVELREVLADWLYDGDQEDAERAADALIAGPLAPLLAENERLRTSAHNWELTARDCTKVLDRVNGLWGDALDKGERLSAQVEAVREVVSNTPRQPRTDRFGGRAMTETSRSIKVDLSLNVKSFVAAMNRVADSAFRLNARLRDLRRTPDQRAVHSHLIAISAATYADLGLVPPPSSVVRERLPRLTKEADHD